MFAPAANVVAEGPLGEPVSLSDREYTGIGIAVNRRSRIRFTGSNEHRITRGDDIQSRGEVMKTQPSYTFTETTGRPEFSLLSGRAGSGRGTIGASKSFQRSMQPVFTPREFTLLDNYQDRVAGERAQAEPVTETPRLEGREATGRRGRRRLRGSSAQRQEGRRTRAAHAGTAF